MFAVIVQGPFCPIIGVFEVSMVHCKHVPLEPHISLRQSDRFQIVEIVNDFFDFVEEYSGEHQIIVLWSWMNANLRSKSSPVPDWTQTIRL